MFEPCIFDRLAFHDRIVVNVFMSEVSENNGGQLGYAMIRIVENKSETELPIFIYESELKTFRNDLSLGVELRETSRWTREDNEIK